MAQLILANNILGNSKIAIRRKKSTTNHENHLFIVGTTFEKLEKLDF